MADYCLVLFFFNDTATTEIYTLSLHDALPISRTYSSVASPRSVTRSHRRSATFIGSPFLVEAVPPSHRRSEEHTSELQSRQYLVCRLLLEKKKNKLAIIL